MRKFFGILAILALLSAPIMAQQNAVQNGTITVNILEGCTIDVSIPDIVFDPSVPMDGGWILSTSADPVIDISWRFATDTPVMTLTLGAITNNGDTLASLDLFRYSALGFANPTGTPLTDVLSRGANGASTIYTNNENSGSDSGTIQFEMDEANLLAQDLIADFPAGAFSGIIVFKITGVV